MNEVVTYITYFGLIVLAIFAWKKHRSYDVQDYEPIVKRRHK